MISKLFFFSLAAIYFTLPLTQAHPCNITDTIDRASFHLSRCTFVQNQSEVTINMTFVVLNQKTSYSTLADGIKHYLVYNNWDWMPIGDFKLDQRKHKIGEIIQANMTMPYKKAYSDETKLDWRSVLYCTDFAVCGTSTVYQIIMPWEKISTEISELENQQGPKLKIIDD